MQQSRLVRSDLDKMVAGVCGGLAAYMGIDPVLVRLAFVILSLASGVGLVIYLILWVIMPVGGQGEPAIRIMNADVDSDPSAYKARYGPAATIGVIMILFGTFFLLSQFGGTSGYIWPLILIGAGVYYLFRRTQQ